MSGVDPNGLEIRKGAADAIGNYLVLSGGKMPIEVKFTLEEIARSGGTSLVVAERSRGTLG